MKTLDQTPAQTQDSAPVKERKPIRCGDFQGAFGKFQLSAFGELNRAGFPREVSHKVAMDYGSNIGDAMRNGNDESFRNKVGKAKKDGQSSIRISASGMTLTSRAMSLIRVCQVIDGLYEEHLLDTRKIVQDNLSESLTQYVSDSAKWASEQIWAE